MKNIETPDKMHLSKLIDDLKSGEFCIPDFQRDFEWSAADVRDLLRSVFEDYYIGTLLFWRATQKNIKSLNCKHIYGFAGENNHHQHIVLDGQQRLSALYYALIAPDENFPDRVKRCFFFIKLDKLLNKEFDGAFYYDWEGTRTDSLFNNKEKQFQEKIMPMSFLGEDFWFEWFQDYKNYWSRQIDSEKAEDEAKKIISIFKDQLSNYDVSYIELDRDIDISKVCDIFTRINNKGLTLNIFDLLNALMTPQNILLRSMWKKVSDSLSGYAGTKAKIYILQTISILKQGSCNPKNLYYLVPEVEKTTKNNDGSQKTIVLFKSSEEFKEKWDSVIEEIKKTIARLKNPKDFGAINPKLLPYPTMLPILAALYMDKEKGNYPDNNDIENKIKKWYWSSVFLQNYSSSVDSQMAHDFSVMKKWFSNKGDAPRVVRQFENELDNFDLSYENRPNSAIYKAVLNILAINGARDFDSFNLPEYSELEDHHIVPRSWGNKHVNNRKIDTILNRTLLDKKTNRQIISDRLPNAYLKELFDNAKNKEAVYKMLESHLLSRKAVDILMRDNFSPDDFDEFIEERQKTILREIKFLLGIDKYDSHSVSISPQTPFSNSINIKETIGNCDEYLYWVDKYFNKTGLEILFDALSSKDVDIKKIKILTSKDKADEGLRKQFKRFREELKNNGIDAEMRVISEKNIVSSIHDRWIIGKYKTYNIPSPDVIMRGQHSEINESNRKIPFEEWWKNSLDIIEDWDKISNL